MTDTRTALCEHCLAVTAAPDDDGRDYPDCRVCEGPTCACHGCRKTIEKLRAGERNPGKLLFIRGFNYIRGWTEDGLPEALRLG